MFGVPVTRAAGECAACDVCARETITILYYTGTGGRTSSADIYTPDGWRDVGRNRSRREENRNGDRNDTCIYFISFFTIICFFLVRRSSPRFRRRPAPRPSVVRALFAVDESKSRGFHTPNDGPGDSDRVGGGVKKVKLCERKQYDAPPYWVRGNRERARPIARKSTRRDYRCGPSNTIPVR